MKWKETIVRAVRTFLQAAVGYVAANLALIEWTDETALKKGVTALITAAVACGLAAIMNLPEKHENTPEEGEKGGEDE